MDGMDTQLINSRQKIDCLYMYIKKSKKYMYTHVRYMYCYIINRAYFKGGENCLVLKLKGGEQIFWWGGRKNLRGKELIQTGYEKK